jgi:hypothetical protein
MGMTLLDNVVAAQRIEVAAFITNDHAGGNSLAPQHHHQRTGKVLTVPLVMPDILMGISLLLFFVAVLENFGYRQLNSVWRVMAFVQWAMGRPSRWGVMTRTTRWKIRE